MKALLLTFLFTLPFVVSAASFELVADNDLAETTQVTLYVTPDEETVYTAKAVVAFDEKTLSVSDIAVANGWIALSQSGYDSQENGQIIKTAGFPGGITEKTALLTFTATKASDGVSIIAIEGTSFVLNAESENVVQSLDVLTLGTPSAAVLPTEFTLSEAESTGEVTAPLPEVTDRIALPAAVVTVGAELAVVPAVIGLLVLLAGFAVYFMIRSGRRRA